MVNKMDIKDRKIEGRKTKAQIKKEYFKQYYIKNKDFKDRYNNKKRLINGLVKKEYFKQYYIKNKQLYTKKYIKKIKPYNSNAITFEDWDTPLYRRIKLISYINN